MAGARRPRAAVPAAAGRRRMRGPKLPGGGRNGTGEPPIIGDTPRALSRPPAGGGAASQRKTISDARRRARPCAWRRVLRCRVPR